MASRFIGTLVLAVTPAIVAAWSVQSPRDTVTYREGTASIAGVVVAQDGGAPISRAIVVVGGGALASFSTTTDSSGRFVFNGLPAGQVTLSASKPQFLSMSYGQTEPGRGSGLPVTLKEGEQRTGLRWALPRAGSISGRLLDDVGRPMRGAPVVVQQRKLVDGEQKLVACCGQTTTDFSGLYRLTGLVPGEYAVSALPPGDFRFVPDVMSSFGSETRRVTDEEVQWALREIANASSASAVTPTRAPEPPRGRTVSYGRIYFPGTAEASRATMVAVKSGDERSGVDFSMQLLPTAFIQGRVLGPDGQPTVASFAFSDGWSTATVRLGNDGRFERRNLMPGRYTLTMRGVGAPLWGSRVIDLNGVDVPDVVITLGPAASVSGRVIFEPGETAPNLATAQVSMTLRPTAGVLPVRVAADGSFSFPVVDPGRYRLSASIPAAARGPWILKSVAVGERDAADMPFEVAPAQTITDVVVTFTTRSTQLSGTLFAADDSVAAGYYVVVFADDSAYWTSASRRVPPPARASTDGRFTFSGLPAGTYRLAALTSVDESDLNDPAFLAALKPNAITVTLADGEKKTQDVKFARNR